MFTALFAGDATIEALPVLRKRSQRYSLRFGSALGMIFKALRHEKMLSVDTTLESVECTAAQGEEMAVDCSM